MTRQQRHQSLSHSRSDTTRTGPIERAVAPGSQESLAIEGLLAEAFELPPGAIDDHTHRVAVQNRSIVCRGLPSLVITASACDTTR